ncbi:MAG: lysyl-tRNA synthetase, partial [Candidatus Berkelbacteria bacterium Licking1014_85]
HYTKGGTFDIAKNIAKKIFKINPAFGFGYEWFLVGGRKMSSSKGVGISAKDIGDDLPPEILKFLLTNTIPTRQINFTPEDRTIPDLFDKFDSAQEDKMYRMRFSKVAVITQMPHINILDIAQKEKGEKLTNNDIDELNKRIKYARIWLKKYADDEFKLVLQDKMPDVELSNEQVDFLSKIAEVFSSKKIWTGEELHKSIHQIKTEQNIDPKIAFEALYQIFLNRSNGPQIGWFLSSLDYNFVLNRLKSYPHP